MRNILTLLFITVITGCVSMMDVPTSTPIHDNHITLVKNTVNLGKQTLYANQKLSHFMIDGIDSYCSDMFSMDTSLYRCFSIENGVLVKGLNPETSKWVKLPTPVQVIRQ